MQAKSVMLASMVCAALLAAGCGDSPQNDAIARNDNAPPPVTTPRAPTTTNSAGDAGANMAGALSDTTLTAKVKTALIAEPGLKSAAIEVSTKDAVVTLTGTVDSSTDRAKARMVAENVQGVRNVVDNLALKS
jgi:hyperosmotically inducible protein